MAKKQQDTDGAIVPALEDDAVAVAQAPAQDLLTVSELGALYEPQQQSVGEDGALTRNHLGADAAHGWTRHKHFKGEEVRMSEADYKAAIAAFKAGSTHAPANMRPLTVHTEDQMEAKLAADKAAPKPLVTQRQQWTPAHARALTMARAKELSNVARKVRG